MEASTFVLRGLVVLDSEGRRIAARHYCNARGQSNAPSEASLEKAIASRAKSKESSTLPSEPDVDMISGFTVLHRSSGELQLAAIGAESENELVLANVVNCLTDSLATLLGSPLQRRAALENLDLLLVALDEICDNGIILETVRFLPDPSFLAPLLSLCSFCRSNTLLRLRRFATTMIPSLPGFFASS